MYLNIAEISTLDKKLDMQVTAGEVATVTGRLCVFGRRRRTSMLLKKKQKNPALRPLLIPEEKPLYRVLFLGSDGDDLASEVF